MYRSITLVLCLLLAVHCISSFKTSAEGNSNDSIPYKTRIHWMRVANQALLDLVSPCPFAAFGTAIVNHTVDGLGELVCIGVNENQKTGNPSMHGEIAAITNCSAILTAKNGRYGLSPDEALNAFSQLSLYTNGESCPMLFDGQGLRSTSISTLINEGWQQIHISSQDVFSASADLGPKTTLISNVLSNETDPFFKWQYNRKFPCPTGCRRCKFGESCEPF